MKKSKVLFSILSLTMLMSMASCKFGIVSPSATPSNDPSTSDSENDPEVGEVSTPSVGEESVEDSTQESSTQGWPGFGDNSGWVPPWQTSTSTQPSTSPSTSTPVDTAPATSGTFVVTTDLASTKEIHTAQQKEYLSYNGSYETIPTSKYPDGNQHLSDPTPVNLQWNHSVTAGKSINYYSVTFGQKSDLSDGYRVTGTANKSIDLYNVFLGNNYFKIRATYQDGSAEESDIYSFHVDETSPRNLKIDGMTNCRDMGGRTNADGGKIKQGLIYRTSATSGWGNGKAVISDNISASGKEELLNHLKVKTEINVNTNGNGLSGVSNFVGAYMDYDQSGSTRHHFSRNAESVKKVFATLADEKNYPIFYHCRIGTDRTGLVAILVNGLLGVSENEIFQDYLFSNFGNIQEKRNLGEQAGQDNILKYVDEIRAMPGEKFHNKVYNMLLSIGVPASQLDSVINILTEGNKPSGNNNGQRVGVGRDLTPSGVSAQTSSDRNHPSVYYSLKGSNQSVSYSFSVSEAYKAKFVGYLGNSTASDSLVKDAISLKLDNQEVTIPSISYKNAGFGSIGGGWGSSGRMCYYSVILGEGNLSAGNHTLTITWKKDSMNIGVISAFNMGTASNPGTGSGNGGNTSTSTSSSTSTGTATPQSYSYDVTSATNTSLEKNGTTYVKHNKGGSSTWNLSNVEPGRYTLSMKCTMTSSGHSSRYWYNMAIKGNENASSNPDTTSQDPYRYVFKVGNTSYDITNTQTYGENGMTSSTDVNSAVAVIMCEVVVDASSTTISVTRCNIGYSVYVFGLVLTKVA